MGLCMSSFILDEDVVDYIQSTFGDEKADELLRSFELLYGFGLQYPDSEFVDLISSASNTDPSVLNDRFYYRLVEKLVEIIKQHNITIKKDQPIYLINEFLSGLLLIQYLNDYRDIDYILSSTLPNDEKFAEVIHQVTVLTPLQVLDLIDELQDQTVILLQDFVKMRIGPTISKEELPQGLLNKLRSFNEFIEGTETLGRFILDIGMPVGIPIDNYIPYLLKQEQTNTPAQTALNILSVLLLSKEGYNLPIVAYRKIANQLFTDLNQITRIETLISRINSDFETFIMAKSQGAKREET